ncbi:MAG: hypothetical protein C0451_13690 [Comamonadaceae bacterium]|nr:hypothetical protein [Comamonadaceae bacterium]
MHGLFREGFKLAGRAGQAVVDRVRGKHTDIEDQGSSTSGIETSLREEASQTPSKKSRGQNKPRTQTPDTQVEPPVAGAGTLMGAPRLKAALVEYGHGLIATEQHLRGAQTLLSKDPPDFPGAQRRLEEKATEMLGDDLRGLQQGLGLERTALHNWLVSPDRTGEDDPVAALKIFLKTKLQAAGHSAPQSEAMAAWLFDQIMVTGGVCLTAQSAADPHTFRTYLDASVQHINSQWQIVKDDAAVDQLMHGWASAHGEDARVAQLAFIHALRQQALAADLTSTSSAEAHELRPASNSESTSKHTTTKRSTTADVSAEESGDDTNDASHIDDLINIRNQVQEKKMETAQQKGTSHSFTVPLKTRSSTEDSSQTGSASSADEPKGSPSAYTRVLDTAAERLEKALKDAADQNVLYSLTSPKPEEKTTKTSKAIKMQGPGETVRRKTAEVVSEIKLVLKGKAVSNGKEPADKSADPTHAWGKFDGDGKYKLTVAGQKVLQKLLQRMREKQPAEWTTDDLVGVIDVLTKFPGNPFELPLEMRSTMMEADNLAANAQEMDQWLAGLEQRLGAINTAQ